MRRGSRSHVARPRPASTLPETAVEAPAADGERAAARAVALTQTRTQTEGGRGDPRRDDHPVAIGAVLGDRYEILRHLGAGGMGTVYEARDRLLGMAVALKFVRPALAQHPGAQSRLWQEVRLAQSITHVNVVRTFTLEKHDGHLFIVMEMLEGRSLADALRDGPLAVAEAVAVARGVLTGLAAVHARQIVHRDIKPQNIRLCADRVVVMDFGIARAHDAAAAAAAPAAGRGRRSTPHTTIAGTPGYIAPEVLAGGRATAAADLYSVGLLLHEMLTGRLPLEPTTGATAVGGSREPAPPVAAAPRPPVTTAPALAAVIARLLSADPAVRWQTADDTLRALEAAVAPARPRRRARARAAAAIAAVATVVAFGTLEAHRAEPPRQPGPPPLRMVARLDPAARAVATLPRCGAADPPAGREWSKPWVAYQFASLPHGLPAADARHAIQRAFATWQSAAVIGFSEANPLGDVPYGDIQIAFTRGRLDGAFATALYPDAGDVELDDDQRWSVDGEGGLDLETAALHELGHSLGLGHSTDPGDVMYPSYTGVKRRLGDGDRAAIAAIYGARYRWERLAGASLVDVTAVAGPGGRLHALGRDRATGAIVVLAEARAGAGDWGAPTSLGGTFTSAPAIAAVAGGALTAIARGADGAYREVRQTADGAWSDWQPIDPPRPGLALDAPVVAAGADGGRVLFARSADGALWTRADATGGWGPWQRVAAGVAIAGPPSVALNVDGRLELAVRDRAGRVHLVAQVAPGGAWGAAHRLDGAYDGDPVLARDGAGRLRVFTVGLDHLVYAAMQAAPGAAWSAPQSIGGWVHAGSLAVGHNADGHLELYAQGANGGVWHTWQESDGWSGWYSKARAMTGRPAVASNPDGRQELFAVAPDGGLWHTWQTKPSRDWTCHQNARTCY